MEKLQPARLSLSPVVNPVLVIHGGAGTMNKESATPEKRLAYRTALAEALLAVSLS